MKPTRKKVENEFKDLTEAQQDKVYDTVYEAYDSGCQDGYLKRQDEINEEQIGVAYVVEQFDTVTSFEEFRTKYLELVRLNLSYTPPLGLYKTGGQQLFKAKK